MAVGESCMSTRRLPAHYNGPGSTHGNEVAVPAPAMESSATGLGAVSPHRTQRPWQGEVAQKTAPSAITYDPECYLCPGNKRAGGAVNPAYDSIFTFVNDYAALLPDAPIATSHSASALHASEPARGMCKVLCFHPDHSLTLARMTRPEIRRVVDAWTREYEELGSIDWIEYVQIFENRGAMMGASNPHPHGQIWSTGFVPDEPAAETRAQREHLDHTGHCLLMRLSRCRAERDRTHRLSRTITLPRSFRGGRSGPLK